MYNLHGTDLNFFGGILGGLAKVAISELRGGGGGGKQRLSFQDRRDLCPPGLRLSSGGNCVRDTTLARTASCPPGQRRTSGGNCVRDADEVFRKPGIGGFLERKLPFGATGFETRGAGPGQAVNGRYGAALEPDVDSRVVHLCLPGMVLGDDNLCYNRGQVPNKRRMWPRGRRPLLTGGDMNCITKAARAARRVKATEKKLQSLGLLKKPGRR